MAAPQRLGLGEYFGSSVRRRQAGGFVVTENRFPPGLEIPLHEHAYAHFTLVLDGGFSEQHLDIALECPAGSVLAVPAGRAHSDQVWSVGAHTLGIELSPKLTSRVNEATGALSAPGVAANPAIQKASERLYAEFRSLDSASLLALEGLAMEILVLVARSQDKSDPYDPRWMPAVMERLHRNPRETASTAELAEIAGVHESHLARSFRRVHGCTIGEYVRWLRLEEAKGDLRNSDRTVAQIAVDVGFYDQAHFSRAFRAAYGTSPSSYRKIFRGS